MSSDDRYMYHHQQQGLANTNYDYSSYPPPPSAPAYSAPLAQPSVRQPPMRTSSQNHSPPQAQFNPPQQPYPPNYGPGPYMAQPPPPPPQPQWSGDSWQYSQYPAPPAPPQPQSEGPYTSGSGRPEPPMPSSSSSESRGYGIPPSNTNMDSRRMVDDRQPPPPSNAAAAAAAAQAKPRRREKEPSPVATSPGTPTGLDFMKLLESYRSIIDGSATLANGGSSSAARIAQGRLPPQHAAETLERMMQSANYGLRVLESTTLQQPTPSSDARSPKDKELLTEEANDPSTDAGSSKRQKTDDNTVQEGQTCLGCNATSTPEWRRGPMGPRTLCNACGLVYAKLIKKRVREKIREQGGRISSKSEGLGAGSQSLDDAGFASAAEGDSDDEDEYGSQDRRSEMGDGGRD